MTRADALLASLVASSAAMIAVLDRARQYAPARSPLVIIGETGTGKTTLAELIHHWSERSERPFVARTAREFDPGLEQSQLFGHERGAFTGAVYRVAGALEEAGEGTLLLDDFHHLQLATQLMLLRAADRWVVRRVGGSRDLPVRCRLIVGMTEDPDALVERGALVPELRYRLGYNILRVPALRDRREDVAGLAERFLALCPEETGVPGPTVLDFALLGLLEVADWPGNVRQLGKVIEAGYLRARGCRVLGPEHLADLLVLPVSFRPYGDAGANKRAVEWAMRATHGDATSAAKLVGAPRSTFYRYLGSDARAPRRRA